VSINALRSPLGVIRGRAEVLLYRWDELSDADKREAVESINLAAERLGRLLDELATDGI
jgi:signal transduction histidine kinase